LRESDFITGDQRFDYLITGGTGSLGQELTRQLLTDPETRSIKIYSRGEYAQWQMKEQLNDKRLKFIIGDVRDKVRLSQSMRGVDYVIHTAALKHVPVCYENPTEAISTNITGTANVIECAVEREVKKVLAVSSDKAVYPINIYGTSKQVLEHLILNADKESNTLFSVIRPGNYFESRGNVFELWNKQAETGECTLTDPDMKRYFIHLADVAKLTIHYLYRMQGGEIFIPKMKEYSMQDLLKSLHPEARIKIIGKRAGERLSEPLWTETEYPNLVEGEELYVLHNHDL
jgi:UDP-N-acetylglucosamine 4,6-dehydratase